MVPGDAVLPMLRQLAASQQGGQALQPATQLLASRPAYPCAGVLHQFDRLQEVQEDCSSKDPQCTQLQAALAWQQAQKQQQAQQVWTLVQLAECTKALTAPNTWKGPLPVQTALGAGPETATDSVTTTVLQPGSLQSLRRTLQSEIELTALREAAEAQQRARAAALHAQRVQHAAAHASTFSPMQPPAASYPCHGAAGIATAAHVPLLCAGARDPGLQEKLYETPRIVKPSGSKRQQLTVDDVVAVYKLRPRKIQGQNGHNIVHCSVLAALCGVTSKTIRDVWSGRTWVEATRHLWTDEEVAMRRAEKSSGKSCRGNAKRNVAPAEDEAGGDLGGDARRLFKKAKAEVPEENVDDSAPEWGSAAKGEGEIAGGVLVVA